MSQRSRTDPCGGCRATGIPTATGLLSRFTRFTLLMTLSQATTIFTAGLRSVSGPAI